MVVQDGDLTFQVANIIIRNLELLTDIDTGLVPQVFGNIHPLKRTAYLSPVRATAVQIHAEFQTNSAVGFRIVEAERVVGAVTVTGNQIQPGMVPRTILFHVRLSRFNITMSGTELRIAFVSNFQCFG